MVEIGKAALALVVVYVVGRFAITLLKKIPGASGVLAKAGV